MSYPPGTKVICIDATPIPIYCGSNWNYGDFSFPNGFLQEGTIYCVTHSIKNRDGSFGLHLAGLPLFFRGHEGNWHHLRFQRISAEKKKSQKTCKNKHPAPTSLS